MGLCASKLPVAPSRGMDRVELTRTEMSIIINTFDELCLSRPGELTYADFLHLFEEGSSDTVNSVFVPIVFQRLSEAAQLTCLSANEFFRLVKSLCGLSTRGLLEAVFLSLGGPLIGDVQYASIATLDALCPRAEPQRSRTSLGSVAKARNAMLRSELRRVVQAGTGAGGVLKRGGSKASAMDPPVLFSLHAELFTLQHFLKVYKQSPQCMAPLFACRSVIQKRIFGKRVSTGFIASKRSSHLSTTTSESDTAGSMLQPSAAQGNTRDSCVKGRGSNGMAPVTPDVSPKREGAGNDLSSGVEGSEEDGEAHTGCHTPFAASLPLPSSASAGPKQPQRSSLRLVVPITSKSNIVVKGQSSSSGYGTLGTGLQARQSTLFCIQSKYGMNTTAPILGTVLGLDFLDDSLPMVAETGRATIKQLRFRDAGDGEDIIIRRVSAPPLTMGRTFPSPTAPTAADTDARGRHPSFGLIDLA